MFVNYNFEINWIILVESVWLTRPSGTSILCTTIILIFLKIILI